jgi:hypothetical protein
MCSVVFYLQQTNADGAGYKRKVMFTLHNTKLSYVTDWKENPSVRNTERLLRILAAEKTEVEITETVGKLNLARLRQPCPQSFQLLSGVTSIPP